MRLREFACRPLLPVAIGCLLLLGAGVGAAQRLPAIGQTGSSLAMEDPWLAAGPVRKLESDLGGRMVKWGQSGVHLGDETINPVDKMEFVWIPAGMFRLGTDDPEDDFLSGAHPAKDIDLSGFWIGKYPVTWGQFTMYCENQKFPLPQSPGFPKNVLHPVVNITWDQAMAYAKWAGGTLPTEYQWERAARGPKNTNYPWGDVWDASKCANSVLGRRSGTTPVGAFRAGRSGYGCYDMAGNVSQWCLDWASKDYVGKSAPDPQGPPTGTRRAVRGGGWGGISPTIFRSSYRYRMPPDFRLDIVGFRVVVPSK